MIAPSVGMLIDSKTRLAGSKVGWNKRTSGSLNMKLLPKSPKSLFAKVLILTHPHIDTSVDTRS